MSNIKKRMIEIVQAQPDNASYKDIMRELAFDCMVERGMADVRSGRLVSEEEAEQRIRSFRKS